MSVTLFYKQHLTVERCVTTTQWCRDSTLHSQWIHLRNCSILTTQQFKFNKEQKKFFHTKSQIHLSLTLVRLVDTQKKIKNKNVKYIVGFFPQCKSIENT